MYRRFSQKMRRLCLLFSLVVLCVLSTPLFAIKAHAQEQSTNEAYECKVDCNLKALEKEADMIWEKNSHEKLGSMPPQNNAVPKVIGRYPKTPGMILVTKDRYKHLIPLGHAAMVYDKQRVVEALSHGVTFGNNDWYLTRKTVFGLKVRHIKNKQGKGAAEWCKKQIGKPYNFAYWNPDRRDAFYCSQLVWAAYKDLYGIEIVEKRRFKAIYPPDLINSKALKEVYIKTT